MKISTKGRYALRVLLDLAEHREDNYIPLKDIAARQGISKNYLEQIMMILNKSNFLNTTRGYLGGYRLARTPDQYSVGDILRVTEGSLSPVACLEEYGTDCERSTECMARWVWQGLEKVQLEYLDNLSLQDILDQYNEEGVLNFSI